MVPSLILSLALSVSPGHAAIPDADYSLKLDNYDLNIRDYNFPSGLRVMFQSERSQPVVAITLVFDRGSEHDQPGYDGIAHVVEHLAFRAEHAGLPKNWDLISQLGGNINASTSNDWTNYMTVAPVDAMIPLMRLEALRMKDGVANVTQEVVRLESEIARNELRMRYENAAIGAAWDTIGKELYPADHPYARSTIGNHETLSALDLEHVQEFVRDNYRPEYTTLVVVGDFSLDETWSSILSAFETELELLMAPEDAKKYLALKTDEERSAFIEAWVPRLQEYMSAVGQTGPKPRVDCDARPEPPPPTTPAKQAVGKVKGMVENETIVLAWSLPGGYCADEMLMNVAANNLTNQIYWTLNSDWNFGANDGLEGIGCFASGDEYNTTMYCFIEPGAAGGSKGERLIDKAGDALYLQWDRSAMSNPYYKAFFDWSFNTAKMSQMTNTLLSVDEVASLGGRATQTAMFTHFTADPTYFSTNMTRLTSVEFASVQTFAEKYLTRDRMVAAIVEPMDEEERDRREAEAAASKGEGDTSAVYHAAKAEDRYKLVFDRESLTPEAIERVTITPDRSKITELTLPNGLRVAIMPYGEAPIVRAGLQVSGDDTNSEPWGLNRLAESLYTTGAQLDSNENLLKVAARAYAPDQNTIVAEGPSGNLDALLHQLRNYVEGYDWQAAAKREKINDWQAATKGDGDEVDVWASRMMSERIYPGHPLGNWWTNEAYDLMRTWSMDQVKTWVYRKWQPANAELVVVGKVDAEATRLAVEKYFGGWAARSGVETGPIEPVGKPAALPDRQVLVFDKPVATQTQVTLACQIRRDTDEETARAQVVADVMSENLWRTLREEAGVTYGAGAYPSLKEGGTAVLYMSSLVQNDAVGFAVGTMMDIVAESAEGKVSEDALLASKWTRARQYGLGQQSGAQMMSRLLSVDVGDFDFFDAYPKQLGAVSLSDFGEVLAPCGGHEVVTVIGPREYSEKQLTEKGIPYEVVDWEALYETQLTAKELKKHLKSKEKEAKEKAAEG